MYVAIAWMRKSDDLQDVMYVAIAWMRKSDDLQDVMYVAIAWTTYMDVLVSRQAGCHERLRKSDDLKILVLDID